MKLYLVTIIFMMTDLLLIHYWLIAPAKYLEAHFGQEVTVVGYVEPLTYKATEKRKSFLLSCDLLQIDGKSYSYNSKLRVYTESDISSSGKIRVRGKLEKLRSFANPGSFNMDTYNWVQGIGGAVTKARAEQIGEGRLIDELSLINLRLKAIVEQNVPSGIAGIMTGMVLGGNQMEEEQREIFRKNGLSHLLSVSGTHLMLLASFLQALLKCVKAFGERKRRLVIVLLLAIYAGVCGFKPPVLRALAMSSVLCWGGDSRNAERGKILCLISMVMLLFKPVWLLDLGFQLSFGATAGLIWFLPKLKESLDEYLTNFISNSLAVTIAAQLATLPILIANFYTVSLISIVSNLLLVPILELATIFTLLGMLLCFVWSHIGGIILQLAAWLVEQVMLQAELLARVPYGELVVGALPAVCGCLYYMVVFSWLDIGPFLMLSRKERQVCIGSCSGIILACYIWARFSPIPTTIYFLDVGQGDGAVVLTPQRKIVVIDTGGLKSIDTGAKIIIPFLHYLGASKVDIIIPSHCDFDHIGGAIGLARNMEVKKILLPNENLDKEQMALMNSILRYIRPNNINAAVQGNAYDLGGTVLKLISVPKVKAKGNDASTVTEISDKRSGRKAIFTGDMSCKREQHLMNLQTYDVLKVGHHGSKSSTSDNFLSQIRPKLAIISCGYRNMYGHPHKLTLERLKNSGSRVLRTDIFGCVRVELAEEGIRCISYNHCFH